MTNSPTGENQEEYYQKYYGSRSADWYQWLLAEVVLFGCPGGVLDLGCGVGLLAELGGRWGISVSGLDASEAAIRLARRRNPHLALQRRDLACALPFPDRSVENIVLHQVIPHLGRDQIGGLLSECYRVLSHQGVVFIFSASKANRQVPRIDPTQHDRVHPSELRAALETAGFELFREPNSPRFSPRSRLLAASIRRLMRTRLCDWLSATANAYAKRLS